MVNTTNSNDYLQSIRCKYYSPHIVSTMHLKLNTDSENMNNFKQYLENFQTHLLDELNFDFSVIIQLLYGFRIWTA